MGLIRSPNVIIRGVHTQSPYRILNDGGIITNFQGAEHPAPQRTSTKLKFPIHKGKIKKIKIKKIKKRWEQ